MEDKEEDLGSVMEKAIRKQQEFMESPEGKAEMKAQAIERISDVEEVSIHKWSPALLEYSIPSVWLKLTPEWVDAIAATFDDKDHPALIPLAKEIQKTIIWENVFPRLSSRSPKDTFYTSHEYGLMCKNADEVLTRFAGSMRIMDDLSSYKRAEIAPHIVLRKWKDMKPYEEFRVFIRERVLYCMSQMYYREGAMPQLRGKRMFIWEKAEKFVKEIAPYLPAHDSVCDVVVPLSEEKAYLIEVNPWNPSKTDPCLFKWEEILGQSTGGEIRIITE